MCVGLERKIFQDCDETGKRDRKLKEVSIRGGEEEDLR